MTDPDRLSEDFTQWLIWHHGADTQCGALHRDSGLAITAGTPAALTEAITHLETLLVVGHERPELWNGVNQALLAEGGDDLPSGPAGDAELLHERSFGRDGLPGGVGAAGDSVAQFFGDLSPNRHVTPEVDHDPTVVDHGRGHSFRYEHGRPCTSRNGSDHHEETDFP